MAVFRVLDQHVVAEAEFRARQEDLSEFFARRATGGVVETFELSGGRALEGIVC